MNEPKFIKQYKRKVKGLIPYNYPDRKKILGSITEMLSEYMDEFPEAKYEDLINTHGTPEKLAAAILGSLDDDSVLNMHKKQKKKYIYTTAIVLASVVCIVAAAMLHNKNAAINKAANAGTNSGIYIERKRTITRYVSSDKSYEITENEDVHEKLPQTIPEKITAQADLLYKLLYY